MKFHEVLSHVFIQGGEVRFWWSVLHEVLDFFGEVKWKLVKSNTVHRGGPEVSKKILLNSIQRHGHLSQVHIEELLQSKPFLPIRQLPPSQCCGDHHLWSILDNPRHMSSSCADNGPSTSYPPRALRPWDTWVKESRNVFCPHSPYRYAGTQNRGRVADMLHSCPTLPSRKRFFVLFFRKEKLGKKSGFWLHLFFSWSEASWSFILCLH